MINSMKISEDDKKLVKEAIRAVIRIELDKDIQINEIEQKLIKIFNVCKVIITENKKLEEDIRLIKEMTRTKIKIG